MPPQAALQLTLILHELATNAKQHGALSRAQGSVRLSWEIEAGEPGHVVLNWEESGGPSVDPPSQRGFGRQLIERTGRLPYITCRLDFPPSGVRCSVRVALSEASPEPTPYFNPRSTRDHSPTYRADPGAGARRSGRRILVVEDDPLDALRIEEALSDAGYLVVGLASSAADAEFALRQLAFDAVVVDIDAATLDGAKVADDLLARSLPVVAIDGRCQTREQNGSRVTVSRPLVVSELVDSLEGLLRR